MKYCQYLTELDLKSICILELQGHRGAPSLAAAPVDWERGPVPFTGAPCPHCRLPTPALGALHGAALGVSRSFLCR